MDNLVHRIAIWDFIDRYTERRYVFMRKWFPWFCKEPVYLWNGGWDD